MPCLVPYLPHFSSHTLNPQLPLIQHPIWISLRNFKSFSETIHLSSFVMAMGSYRRAKLALDAARGFTARIAPNAASREPISRVFSTALSTPASNAAKFSGFPSNSSILHKSLGGTTTTTPYKSPSFRCTIKRDYCVDRNAVRKFKPGGLRKWFENPINVSSVCLVVARVAITGYFGNWFDNPILSLLTLDLVLIGGLITLYFMNLEKIPYTNRTHLVFMSKELEKRLGEALFQQKKASFKGKILPATHPDTVRVSLIAKDIIDKSRKTWKERGSKAATSHLDRFNWEVLVVDHPGAGALSMPGGKIVVSTELLKLFGSDFEIATFIGHEVGHVVARHFAEIVATESWFTIPKQILQFVKPDVVNTMFNRFSNARYRRMEIEADHIGLLLVASAGYDPRMVPAVYEKMGKFEDSEPMDFHSYYPFGKERAQLLSQAKIMDDALAIYRDVRAGRGY